MRLEHADAQMRELYAAAQGDVLRRTVQQAALCCGGAGDAGCGSGDEYERASEEFRKVEQYVEGLREGTAKEFSEDGRVVTQVEYRNNREVAAK